MLLAGLLLSSAPASANGIEWVGDAVFAEPFDGGNLDTVNSTLIDDVVTIVPRGHASEALGGQVRWRNFLFAMRSVQDRPLRFALPLRSPGTEQTMLNQDVLTFGNVKPVWSYDRKTWHSFDHYSRAGTGAAMWTISFRNDAPFKSDVVWIAINEQYPVEDYYHWLRETVFRHPLVTPAASADTGTYMIGEQAGGSAPEFGRTVPATPLYAFRIQDPAAQPTKVCILVAGQHPYEGQNKWALQGAVEFILSDDPRAVAYRREYVTLVYPHVNPTGEIAGLWRGTAANVYADVNRNWTTNKMNVDTVTIHRRAMLADIADVGLGAPTALFDFHQTYENVSGHVIRSKDVRPTVTAAYLERLRAYYPNTLDFLAPNGVETLRSWSNAVLGTACTITCERSVYSTAGHEMAYGETVIAALLDFTLGAP